MAVNAIRIQSSYRGTLNFSISSKVSQETGLLKALENKKFWDELLEKLRKSGGGGGSDSRFDRIAVSMILSNFLTNKMVLALMKNLKIGLENLLATTPEPKAKNLKNQFINFVSSIYKMFVSTLGSIQVLFIRFTNTNMIQKTVRLFNEIAGIVSFQMNKLKDMVDSNLKQILKKLKIKHRLNRTRDAVFDFIEGIKEEVLNIIGVLAEKLLYVLCKAETRKDFS